MQSKNFTLLLLLFSLIFSLSSSQQIPQPPPIQDCYDNYGNYNCNICTCSGYTNVPIYISYIVLFLAVTSLLTCFLLVFAQFAIPKLKSRPGDLIFAITLEDIVWSAGYTSMASFTLFDPQITWEHENVCVAESMSLSASKYLRNCYTVAFFVFYARALKQTIKRSKIPQWTYHLTAILCGTGFFLYNLKT
jgi:hypothetical protein